MIEVLEKLIQKQKPKETSELLFYSPLDKSKPIARQTVNKMLERLTAKIPEIQHVNPHKFRHTSASTLLTEGANLTDVQNYLGHESYETTTIYSHSPVEDLREKLERSAKQKPSIFERLNPRRKSDKNLKITHFKKNLEFVIGRDNELTKINDLVSREVSVIITGKTGVGKTHLIENLDFGKRVLEFDDTKEFKKQILSTILFLFEGDKERAKELLFMGLDLQAIKNKISRDSLINLCKFLCEITDKKEYVLKINDLDGVTPTVVKAWEVLKGHFIILTATRELKLKNASFT